MRKRLPFLLEPHAGGIEAAFKSIAVALRGSLGAREHPNPIVPRGCSRSHPDQNPGSKQKLTASRRQHYQRMIIPVRLDRRQNGPDSRLDRGTVNVIFSSEPSSRWPPLGVLPMLPLLPASSNQGKPWIDRS
jgi:hypothetical protein